MNFHQTILNRLTKLNEDAEVISKAEAKMTAQELSKVKTSYQERAYNKAKEIAKEVLAIDSSTLFYPRKPGKYWADKIEGKEDEAKEYYKKWGSFFNVLARGNVPIRFKDKNGKDLLDEYSVGVVVGNGGTMAHVSYIHLKDVKKPFLTKVKHFFDMNHHEDAGHFTIYWDWDISYPEIDSVEFKDKEVIIQGNFERR